jgi:hypothetical protein
MFCCKASTSVYEAFTVIILLGKKHLWLDHDPVCNPFHLIYNFFVIYQTNAPDPFDGLTMIRSQDVYGISDLCCSCVSAYKYNESLVMG